LGACDPGSNPGIPILSKWQNLKAEGLASAGNYDAVFYGHDRTPVKKK
jgi:hypothetical protein